MNATEFPAFDESGFDTQVLARPGLTVVDFWSTSCIPCRQMTRLLKELAAEVPAGVAIGQVDADANPHLLERYKIRGLPTLLMFKDGQLVETRTGIDRKQVLRKAIESHV